MGPVSETLCASSTIEHETKASSSCREWKASQEASLRCGPCDQEPASPHIHNISNSWTQRHACKSHERRIWARLALRYGDYLCSTTLESRFLSRCSIPCYQRSRCRPLAHCLGLTVNMERQSSLDPGSLSAFVGCWRLQSLHMLHHEPNSPSTSDKVQELGIAIIRNSDCLQDQPRMINPRVWSCTERYPSDHWTLACFFANCMSSSPVKRRRNYCGLLHSTKSCTKSGCTELQYTIKTMIGCYDLSIRPYT